MMAVFITLAYLPPPPPPLKVPPRPDPVLFNVAVADPRQAQANQRQPWGDEINHYGVGQPRVVRQHK